MNRFNQLARTLGTAAMTVLLFGTGNSLAAQAMGTIYGNVSAAESGEPIAGAQVTLHGTVRRTVTDAQGNYRIPAEAGTYTVVATTLGRHYQSRTVSVNMGGTATANFSLSTSAIVIEGAGADIVGSPASLVDEVKQHRMLIEAQQKLIDDLMRRVQALEQQKKE